MMMLWQKAKVNVNKHRYFARIRIAAYCIDGVGLVSGTVTLVPLLEGVPDANKVPFCSKIGVEILVFEPS